MPCRYDDDGSVDRAELDRLTRLLCYVCDMMKDRPGFDIALMMNNDLAQWWDHHQTLDRARREQENREKAAQQTREAAMAKLTPEERKALGL